MLSDLLRMGAVGHQDVASDEVLRGRVKAGWLSSPVGSPVWGKGWLDELKLFFFPYHQSAN